MARKDVSTLRDEAVRAVEKGRWKQAIAAYEELERRQPADPSWSRRLGEVHRRTGDTAAAIAAFERSAERYVQAGFLVQAIAVCKLILQLDPACTRTAERLAEITAQARGPAPAPPAGAPRAVTLPPGAGLAAVPLAEVVPGARRVPGPDGAASGVIVIPIDEDAPPRGRAIEDAIAAAGPADELDVELLGSGEIELLEVPDPEAARRALARTPLLAGLPAPALEAVVERLDLVTLAPREALFHEGDAGDALYVISEGEVIVASARAELARLGPGAFFGEIALVTDLPRSASVRAGDAPVELLAIDRGAVRDLVAAHPEVLRELLRFVRDRLVDRVTRTGDLFRPFTPGERAALAGRFELVEVDPGTPLIVQGARADGLYTVLAGRAEVWRDGDPAAVAALGPGEVFGEMSLLSGGGSTAHVRAGSRVLALRMPAPTFQEVIMTHPQVLAYVGELAEGRARRAGGEELSDELVDLRLELL